MIINVTEEQKKLIESQGYMVVEFKAWAKNFLELFTKWSAQVVDTWNLILGFLEQMAIRCSLALKEFAICVKERLEPLTDMLDNLEMDYPYEPRKKYPFVRSLGMKYQPSFSHRVIYHRCRDRC